MGRYKFTRDDCVKGGKSRFEQIVENNPELLIWLKKKIRKHNKAAKEAVKEGE